MKPIQTLYKGCRFRSRLEARWAVFFDELELPWEYEKEGFQLADGMRYLPDFWLPTMDCFFEVKGAAPVDSEKQLAKQLSIDSKKLVVMASGSMSVEELRVGTRSYGEWPTKGFNLEVFAGESHSMWAARSYDFSMWNWCLETDLPTFLQETFPDEVIPEQDTEARRELLVKLDRRYFFKKYGKEHPRYMWGRHEKSLSWVTSREGSYCFAQEPDSGLTKISKAYKAARSARFEFGQSGQ